MSLQEFHPILSKRPIACYDFQLTILCLGDAGASAGVWNKQLGLDSLGGMLLFYHIV